MRILVVSHRSLPDYLAGTEVYAAELNRALKERGHDLRLFTGDPAATQAYVREWGGLPVQAVPWGLGQRADPVRTFLAGFLNPYVERRFDQLCAEFKPEVVHIHHLLGLSPRLPAISRRHGARVIVTLHDYWFMCSNTWLFRYDRQLCRGPGLGYHCGGCAMHRLGVRPRALWMALAAPVFLARTAVLRRVLRAVDHLIAPSHLTARLIAQPIGLESKLSVIPHGLAARASPRPARARDGRHPPRYAYVGPLIRPKGIHVVVQAFNAIPPGGEELHLFGDELADPAYVNELRALVSRPGVVFHGKIERQQVPAALQEADLLLVPTLMPETYSVVVDEAFEAGVPVLASAHTAAAERIVPGTNGLVAPPGDVDEWRRQMQRVSREPELLDRLRGGVQPPKSVAVHVREIEGLYAQVLRERV